MSSSRNKVIIIGAGAAGLSAAIDLSAKGYQVVVLEKEAAPGGKMREISVAGAQINAGPTVFTMKWVFDELLAASGTSLEKIISFHKADVLARHAWRDGAGLDLFADIEASCAAIESFSDTANADGYRRFCADSKNMFETLQRTYIDAERPNPLQFVSRIGALNFRELFALQPLKTMWSALDSYFPDKRLQQLFGRYATYCGSSPHFSPSTLMLVAHVEQAGVWIVDGGMHGLAKALAGVATDQGAEFRYNSSVARLITMAGSVCGVELGNGDRLDADHVVFNGDVSALADGLLGPQKGSAKAISRKDRSLSALTWTMRAKVQDFPLSHHNVFFSDKYEAEFKTIFDARALPKQPTVYVCAQDRDDAGQLPSGSDGTESLLLLVNAPADGDSDGNRAIDESEIEQCLMNTQNQLAKCGMKLDMMAAVQENRAMATSPSGFNQLFPATGGALYGPLARGMMAAFKRQGARTSIKGLYLAGGSVHPGSGVPMAVLSGRRAADALVSDHASMR